MRSDSNSDTSRRLRRLETVVADIRADLELLQELVGRDAPSALNKIRYVTEGVLQGLCERHAVTWGGGEPTLERMIGPLLAAGAIPKHIAIHIRTIQTNASPGSHYQAAALGATHVQVSQIALVELLEWYFDVNPSEPPLSPAPRPHRRHFVVLGGVALLAGASLLAVYWPRPEPVLPAPVPGSAVPPAAEQGEPAQRRGEEAAPPPHGVPVPARVDEERAAIWANAMASPDADPAVAVEHREGDLATLSVSAECADDRPGWKTRCRRRALAQVARIATRDVEASQAERRFLDGTLSRLAYVEDPPRVLLEFTLAECGSP